MPGPSPGFLAQLNAGLAADPFAAGAASAGIAPHGAPNADATLMGGGASVGGAPLVIPGVQPAPAPPPAGPPAPPMGQPPAVPVGMPGAGAEDDGRLGRAMPNDVQFAPVHTPGAPAREAETRGPQQKALIAGSYMPGLEAADRIEKRSGETAQHEVATYEAQAAKYLEQQSAMERVAARRQFELQQMQADYDKTIQDIGKFKVDSNRWWGQQSTLDKIGTTILVLLGGASGGLQKAESMVNERIQKDVELQMFDYKRGLDKAKGQQNAYSMALDRYGAEDAAYHAAMASGQLAAAAKVGSLQAQWKGTNAANEADMLRANLLAGAARSASEGYKYLQPTAGGTKYKMFIRGQEVPGLVDESKAQGYSVEHGVKPAERVDETLVKGGIEATLQRQKLGAEAAKTAKAHEVVLPNGESINAPNDKEAETLRGLASAVSSAQDLVREAKDIRKGTAWRVPGSAERRRLESIQSELTLSFKDRGGLGALSGPDMDLALSATGNITSQMPNADAKLDSFANHTTAALRNRVKTIPGAPPKTAGRMPGSFEVAK